MGRFAPAHTDGIRTRSAPWAWPWKQPGYIVIHTMEGTLHGTIAWFQQGSPPRKVATAAHYLVGRDGTIVQMVDDAKKCAHAGAYNSRSIGIEHEARIAPWPAGVRAPFPENEFPEAMLESSARIVRVLCEKYGIPKDRSRIIGHDEVPGATHTDPGAAWPWDAYMARVRA